MWVGKHQSSTFKTECHISRHERLEILLFACSSLFFQKTSSCEKHVDKLQREQLNSQLWGQCTSLVPGANNYSGTKQQPESKFEMWIRGSTIFPEDRLWSVPRFLIFIRLQDLQVFVDEITSYMIDQVFRHADWCVLGGKSVFSCKGHGHWTWIPYLPKEGGILAVAGTYSDFFLTLLFFVWVPWFGIVGN